MPTALAITVFYTIWWLSLFIVLPLAGRSRNEVEEATPPAGVDRGAPTGSSFVRVALWTTVVASVLFVIVDAVVFWMA